MVCWRLQQKDSWGTLTEGQQGKETYFKFWFNGSIFNYSMESRNKSSGQRKNVLKSRLFFLMLWLSEIKISVLGREELELWLLKLTFRPQFSITLSNMHLYPSQSLTCSSLDFHFHTTSSQSSLPVFLCLSVFRTVPFSSDAARPRAPGSRTPWPCSTSRKCTTFPFASWPRCKVMPSEKRARKTKRWEWSWQDFRAGSGRGRDGGDERGFWKNCSSLTPFLCFFHRFLAPWMRWFCITSITSCFW